MDMEELDSSLQHIDENIAKIREDLDNIVLIFVEIACEDVNTALLNRVKDIVLKKAKITIENGEDKVGEMKKELNVLQGKIPDMVRNCLNSDDVWPHKLMNEKFAARHTNSFNHLETEIQKRLFPALKSINSILMKYGYMNPSSPNQFNEFIPTHRMNKEIATYRNGLILLYKEITNFIDNKQLLEEQKAKNIWEKG